MRRPVHRPPLDLIRVSDLMVDCVVGIYRPERVRTQRVQVDAALYLDSRGASHGLGIAASVDYARLCGELKFLLQSTHFLLLEDAAEALARYILLPPSADGERAPVREVTVNLSKPEALGGEARASVEIHRRSEDCTFRLEDQTFGQVDVVHEHKRYSIARLRLAPGRAIPTHYHAQMDEHELLLGSQLLVQGKKVPRGTAFHWPKGHPHRYENPSSIEQSLLCVNSPPFHPSDEIPVAVAPSDLQEIPGHPYYPAEDAEGLVH